jgi:cytochrome c553
MRGPPPGPPEPAPTLEPVAVSPSATSAPPPWNTPLFKDRMHTHFALATDAVYGVILGDLEVVHARSRELAALSPPPGIPEGWISYLEAMSVAADNSAQSASLVDAASDVLTIGRTCANCHQTLASSDGGGPSPTLEQIRASTGATEQAMDRHSYGAYLMWLGLFLPSQTVFAAGVEELQHDNSIPTVAEELKPLEKKVHALARTAGAAPDDQERAGAFADLLRVCADCHTRAGARIAR